MTAAPSENCVYFDEGHAGNSKYTFEVYRQPDDTYVAWVRIWNRKLNKVNAETRFTSPDKEGLRLQDYPRLRQVTNFLKSDFWSNNGV